MTAEAIRRLAEAIVRLERVPDDADDARLLQHWLQLYRTTPRLEGDWRT